MPLIQKKDNHLKNVIDLRLYGNKNYDYKQILVLELFKMDNGYSFIS